MLERAHLLHRYGGSPIGNSRVKLTNTADCVKRGLVKEGENPLKVAADRLAADGITILHTIGGDDTNTTAADLAAYLGAHGYDLTVVGLPKTVDNDVVPIRQSLGAWTAAEVGAHFFDHVSNETECGSAHAGNPRSHGTPLRLADCGHGPRLYSGHQEQRIRRRLHDEHADEEHRRALSARDGL